MWTATTWNAQMRPRNMSSCCPMEDRALSFSKPWPHEDQLFILEIKFTCTKFIPYGHGFNMSRNSASRNSTLHVTQTIASCEEKEQASRYFPMSHAMLWIASIRNQKLFLVTQTLSCLSCTSSNNGSSNVEQSFRVFQTHLCACVTFINSTNVQHNAHCKQASSLFLQSVS